ncbi:AAA family ATPase [Streptomyces sp. HUCO-GS316]|uniref:AAA family ATPase n=1 Tax=Streptomyces sp. HUCO-GS316 TaxID=2692198 RepID=UPI003FA6C8AA
MKQEAPGRVTRPRPESLDFRPGSTSIDTDFPDPAVIVLIGPAGSGKSTLASTWEPTQVLSLDHYRALVSDSPGATSPPPATQSSPSCASSRHACAAG